MKAYEFNLEPVQTVRRREEQVALEAYARALVDRTRASDGVRSAERVLASERAEWQRRAGDGCQAGVLAHRASGCQILVRQLEDRIRLLGEAERIVQQRLQDVLRTSQRLEAVNKLEVRGRQAHAAAAAREEQKFLDELAQRRAGASTISSLKENPSMSL